MRNLTSPFRRMSKKKKTHDFIMIFFLKKISLENNAFSGVVCYARRISEVYKIRPNEKDKDKVLYIGYKENEYPS